MDILKLKSKNKKEAIMYLAKTGYYPVAYALLEAEKFNDEGKLLDEDYLELVDYLRELLQPIEETQDEIGTEETEQTNIEVDTTE